MKTTNKKYSLWGVCALAAVSALTASCADDWEDHYSGAPRPGQTVWQAIESRPELADFAKLLKDRGYDRYLNSNQSYTVWAPSGQLDTTLVSGGMMTADEVLTQVVENHIAHGVISGSSIVADTVTVLNGKPMPFVAVGGVPEFNGTATVEYNIECSNGDLHILAAQAPYNHNVWSALRQDAAISDFTDYLYSFNRWVFDPEASTVGGVVNGERIYIDSVFVLQNDLWTQIGDLNGERDRFVMLAPTNAAWESMITDFRRFYNYEEGNDSLAKAYASRDILDNLVFNENEQRYLPDWISTGGNLFERPFEAGGLFAGVEDSMRCSNGVVYKSSSVHIDPYGVLVAPVTIEAEDSRFLVDMQTNTFSQQVFVAAAGTGVSNSRYMAFTTTSTLSSRPQMTYAIPNVFSCKYDIGVVFVPQNLTSRGWSSQVEQKNNRVRFTLEDGYSGDDFEVDDVEIDGTKIDTVWVFRGHEFPYCDYFPERTDYADAEITLTIRNRASNSEVGYTRNLYIDCILLKPTNETTGDEDEEL